MNVSRSLVSRLNLLNSVQRNNLAPIQRRTLVSGPPSVRISLAEKIVHMGIMVLGFFTVPLYVLSNVRRYREKS